MSDSCDAVLVDEKLIDLSKRLRSIRKDKRVGFKKYKNVLQGNEIVDFILNEKINVNNRKEALELGQKLIDNNLIHHNKRELKILRDDDRTLYHMHQDDGPTYKQATECSTKFGPLTKKGKLKWNKRLFVLKGAELLYFDAETDLNPKLTIDLGSGSIDLSELGSCKQGFYCFNLKDQNGRTHVMCTEKSKDQEAWIQALVDNGVKFIEDPVNTSLSQKSIFEFEVLDINKQPVNLSKFDGKVCLVVNVASF